MIKRRLAHVLSLFKTIPRIVATVAALVSAGAAIWITLTPLRGYIFNSKLDKLAEGANISKEYIEEFCSTMMTFVTSSARNFENIKGESTDGENWSLHLPTQKNSSYFSFAPICKIVESPKDFSGVAVMCESLATTVPAAKQNYARYQDILPYCLGKKWIHYTVRNAFDGDFMDDIIYTSRSYPGLSVVYGIKPYFAENAKWVRAQGYAVVDITIIKN